VQKSFLKQKNDQHEKSLKMALVKILKIEPNFFSSYYFSSVFDIQAQFSVRNEQWKKKTCDTES